MTSSERLSARLRDRLSLMLDRAPEDLTDDASFASLGVDSMMRLELIAEVEQHLGHELAERDLPMLTSIREVIAYVATQP